MHALAHAHQRFETGLGDLLVPALGAVHAAMGRRAKSGLETRRHDPLPGLIDALAVRYPVVRRMAGESFRAAAHRFVSLRPDDSPILPHFGDTFPSFLRSLGKAASFEYLADIAELERARHKAYRAPNSPPAGAPMVGATSMERAGNLRLLMHPSVSLVASRFPIVTIWQANQPGRGDGMIGRWQPQCALVARPFVDVEVWQLPPGGHALFAALRNGVTLAAAVEAARAVAPALDLVGSLAVLVASNIVIGFGTAVTCGNAGQTTSKLGRAS